MVYEFVVAMKDMVTPGAKSAQGALGGLTSALSQAKNVGGEAFSGLSSGLGAVAKGDFPTVFRSIGHGVTDMLNAVNVAVPGLGTVLSTLGGIAFAIGGSLLDLAYKGMKMALTFSEAKEKTIAMYDALADGHATGEQVAKMIGGLAAATHKTGGDFKPFARELMAMGHRDLPDLRRELLAVASAQALMGDEAGHAYLNMAKKLEIAVEGGGKLKMSSKSLGRDLTAMGLSLTDVAKAMGMTGEELARGLKQGTLEAGKFGEAVRSAVTAKGKGALDRFGGTLEGIGNDFARFWKKAFAEADPSPFLNTLRDMVSGLGGSKDATKGLTGALNAFFQFAAKAIPVVVFAIWDLVNAVLRIAVAFKTGGSTGSVVLDMIVGHFKTIAALIGTVVDGIGLMGKALDKVGGIGNVAKAALGPASFLIPDKKVSLGPVLEQAVSQAPSLGAGFTSGVAEGLRSGEGEVTGATSSLAKKMIATMRDTLQVHSPSRVMMQVGGFTAEGFAIGMRQGVPDVRAAAGALGRGSMSPIFEARGTSPGSDRGGASQTAGRTSITVHVHIEGAGKSAEQITEEMVATVFERIALMQGV